MTDEADEAGTLSAGTVGVSVGFEAKAPVPSFVFRMGNETFKDGDIVCFMNRCEARSRGLNGLLPDPPVLFVVNYDDKMLTVGLEPVSWEAAWKLAPEKMKGVSRDLQNMRLVQGGYWNEPFKVFVI